MRGLSRTHIENVREEGAHNATADDSGGEAQRRFAIGAAAFIYRSIRAIERFLLLDVGPKFLQNQRFRKHAALPVTSAHTVEASAGSCARRYLSICHGISDE